MKATKKPSISHHTHVDYNTIHQACRHIDYKEVKALPQRNMFTLVNEDESPVALIELEGNNVIITQ